MKFHEIYAVAEDSDPGTYLVTCRLTDAEDETIDCVYTSRIGDNVALAPKIREAVEDWILAGNPVSPYSPPTPEQVRAAMPALSARQLRLGLIANSITLASVQTAIDGIPDVAAREVAQVEWEYATSFDRTHSLIAQIGGALNLSPEQIDAMWQNALLL